MAEYNVKLTKAVFPVAGFFGPLACNQGDAERAFLPIVDKPLIQYAVEEAVDAGLETLICDWAK